MLGRRRSHPESVVLCERTQVGRCSTALGLQRGKPMHPASSPGAIARVRQRLYLVEDTVAPTTPEDSTLVRLSCIDDDN